MASGRNPIFSLNSAMVVSLLQLVADDLLKRNWPPPAFVLMEVIVILLVIAVLFVSKKRLTGSSGRTTTRTMPLPPSPPSLPVVGHLHLLGSLPHRRLRALAAKYGPVIHLRLGGVPTVVACSAAAAEEAVKAHNLAFASRPRLSMVDRGYYGSGGMGFAPYGEYWLQARRVCVAHFLNPRLAASLSRIRLQEAAALVGRVLLSPARAPAAQEW